MAVPTLVATPGAINANSYCTVAEADAYHDSVVFRTDWPDTGSEDDAKVVALINATRLLDALYEWAQWPSQPSPAVQALQWPRSGVVAKDRYSVIPSDQIPLELKEATAEFARQLIAADRSADSDVETQGITSIRAGSVALTFKDFVQAKVVPDAVYNLIPSWWGELQSRRGMEVELKRA